MFSISAFASQQFPKLGPPEIEEYCKGEHMETRSKCAKECNTKLGSPMAEGGSASLRCNTLCFNQLDENIKACMPNAARELSTKFLEVTSPDVEAYCGAAHQSMRDFAIAHGFPSVMAQDDYEKNVQKCIKTVKQRRTKAKK
jgi:hypothetical protein